MTLPSVLRSRLPRDGRCPPRLAERAPVEVAVDAAGGDRTYTYLVPDRLADLEPGEAVLVEFGRRQALGIVLGEARAAAGGDAEADRRSRPGRRAAPAAAEPARWPAGSPTDYLAPPALVLRAMLPPGLLERLELVAELAPGGTVAAGAPRRPGDDADAADLLGQLDRGPRPVRDLAGPDGRAGLLRRLRSPRGGRAGQPRMDPARGRRRAALRALDPPRPRTGRAAAAILAAGGRPAGRPLGPRQVEALRRARATRRPRASPAAGPRRSPRQRGGGRPRPTRAGRGRGPRAARAGRWPAGRSGGAAVARQRATCCRPRPRRSTRIRAAIAARDPRPLLLDGVTGGGKTAIYVEAIAAALEAGRPALVLVPEIALALPLVDRLRADLDARVALAPLGPRRRRAGGRVAADPGRRRRHRGRDAAGGRSRRWPTSASIVVDEEHDAAYKSDRTPRLQARDAAIALGALAGAADRPRLGDARGRERRSRADRRVRPASSCRPVRSAPRRRSRSSTCARSWRPVSAACCRGRWPRPWPGSTRPAGEQAILVLNRRGTASVVLCRDCGHVQACPDCERPLVYHQAGNDAALPSLRAGDAARVALPVVRLAADPLPRRRDRARRARGPRHVPGACASARLDRDVVEHRGAAERVVDAFADGRTRCPGRHQPRRQGPRHPGRDAGRRRLVGHRAQPARRARRRADLPAAGPGDRPGRSRRAPGARDRPDLPARSSGDRGRGERRPDRVLRRGAGAARALRLAAVRPAWSS